MDIGKELRVIEVEERELETIEVEPLEVVVEEEKAETKQV